MKLQLFISSACCILLWSCAPQSPPASVTGPVNEATALVEPAVVVGVASAAPPAPFEAPRAPRALRVRLSDIQFDGVAFDSRSHRLTVADQAAGPGSRWPDAAAAGRSAGGIAAVNGGFFTPEGSPLGLVVSSGKSTGSWNSASSLGSGVWYEDSAGASSISRREALGRKAAFSQSELLQAGPLLVENDRAVSGLDSSKSAVRTILLWDGGTRWWIGCTSACPLATLAARLAGSSPVSWPVRHALNLDGGRSSELWISSSVAGGPVSIRPIWNRPVRNFLILSPRN